MPDLQDKTGQKVGGIHNLPQVPAETEKESKEKTQAPLMYAEGGRYAIDLEDDLPPLNKVKFIDEAGRLTDQKIDQKKQITFFWRGHQKTLSVLMAISAFGILIIMLSATTKYTTALWDIGVMTVQFAFDFVTGLLP